MTDTSSNSANLSQLIANKEYLLAMHLAERSDQNDPDYLYNLAKVFHLCHQSYRALRILSKLPEDHQQAQEDIAMILSEIGDTASSLAQYKKVLEQFPDSVISLVNAASMMLNDNSQLAEVWLQRALEISPKERNVLYNLGLLYQTRARWQKAHAYFQQTIALFPNDLLALANFARAQINLRDFDQARQSIDRLKAQNTQGQIPAVAVTELTASLANHEQGPMHGLKILRKWFSNPSNIQRASSTVNAAYYAFESGKYKESLKYCNQILRVKPDHPEANLGVSQVMLLREAFEEGFIAYEHRAELPRYMQNLKLPQIPLDNDSPLSKQDVLLVNTDQGLGDNLMFLRFLPQMAKQAKQVDVTGSDSVKEIMETFASKYKNINVVMEANTEEGLPWNRQCRITSLGRLCRIMHRKDIPLSSGYLQSPRKTAPKWLKKGWDKKNKRYGIVWRGNKLHNNDRMRSIALELLSPLWDIPHTRWFSLQHEITEADRAIWPKALRDLSPHINDFSDLAQTMVNLDAVITIDSAPLHLAGGLAVKAHALIPHVPDWRWGMDTENTYWYDSVRLWRQSKRADWPSVIARLAKHLAKAPNE